MGTTGSGGARVRAEESAEAVIRFSVPAVDEADIDAVVRVLESGWLTTGEECQRLETELAAYLGTEHVVAVSSCTAALEIAAAWLDLGPGHRVGVPAWTFVSSALAPARHGAEIVLLDVDESTLNVSPASLEAALEDGLDAVVSVHFGGVPVDEAVHRLAKDAGVPMIEDAAHALGAFDHRGIVNGHGSLGACLSFYATKNLTCAEGGAIATENTDFATFARSFRLHGLSHDAWARYRPGAAPEYDLIGPGLKANLPDMLAAMARAQLARFPDMQARRRAIVQRYRSNLQAIDGISIVPSTASEGSADHLMVVVLPESVTRAAVVAKLNAAGVSSSVHFKPLHHFEWFRKNATVGPGELAVCDAMAPRVLSLPLYPDLTHADVDRVCSGLADALAP